MTVVWRQEKEWMNVLWSGQRELDKCCQDRMRRYPDCSTSGPGLSQQGGQRLRLRINRSILFQFMQRQTNADTRTHKKRECHQHPFANDRPSCCPHPPQPRSIRRREALSCPRNWILLAMVGLTLSQDRGGHLLYVVEKLVETGQIDE